MPVSKINSLELKKLPKVELHRHLEGSIPIPWVLEWSAKFNLPLPKENIEENIQVLSPQPFAEVLKRIFYQQRCFQNLDSVEKLTYEVLKDIASDEIKLIELRFSPGFMAEPKGLSFDSIMEATLTAKERAQRDFDLEVGFILISSRDYGVDICSQTIDLAIRWKKEIVGIDLAGDETQFPSDLFQKPFQKARALGLPITIHSGEVSAPDQIQISIEKLGARRIGHGVQAIHSPEIIRQLVKDKIPLEVCPTSNVMTQAVSSIDKHPIKKLMDHGVIITINSDDPTLFATTLTREYEVCQNQLGFTLDEIKKTILNSFHASFLSETQKNRAWKKYFKFLEN